MLKVSEMNKGLKNLCEFGIIYKERGGYKLNEEFRQKAIDIAEGHSKIEWINKEKIQSQVYYIVTIAVLKWVYPQGLDEKRLYEMGAIVSVMLGLNKLL